MLDDLVEIEESELPPLTDASMQEFAREMGDEFNHFRDSRKSLETEVWPAVDRGFMCIRDEMSFIPTMKFIDNGMLGESDLRDAVKALRNQIMSGLFPGDNSHLEAIALDETDDEESLLAVKNRLLELNQTSGMRRAATAFVDQLLVRGTSALGLRWDRRRTVHKMPKELAETIVQASEQADDEVAPTVDKKLIKKVKYWKEIYNGPRVYPIDMYRLYLDPAAEIGLDDDVATIYVFFKTLCDLKYAKNDKGEPLYDAAALEDVEEWTYQDYYAENPHSCSSTQLMGVDPSLESMGKFVPVYMFHKQVRETEDGDYYVDKFFYLTRTKSNTTWQIIRVQDNPSDFGDKPFYFTQLDRWLNLPYGTGAVEKSLSAWKKKNIIAAIGTNASVLNVFPPYSYAGGVIKDDKKPLWQPGRGTEIIIKPNVGMDWIKEFPINPINAQFGMQEERYLSEKIIAQTGVSAAGVTNDPTKSMSKSKTATEIKQTATDGVVSEEEIVDTCNGDVFQPLQQSMYNLDRQHNSEGGVSVQAVDGNPQRTQLKPEQLNKDRKILIVGRRGLASKAHELDNLMKSLEVLAQPQAMQVIQNLPMIAQDLLFKLLARLGVPMKEEYRIPPAMLAAQDPQAQMAALQGALQNPEMRQQIAQMLLSSPEGQQFVQQLSEQSKAQAIQEHTSHQGAVKQEASQQVAQQKQQEQMLLKAQKPQPKGA